MRNFNMCFVLALVFACVSCDDVTMPETHLELRVKDIPYPSKEHYWLKKENIEVDENSIVWVDGEAVPSLTKTPTHPVEIYNVVPAGSKNTVIIIDDGVRWTKQGGHRDTNRWRKVQEIKTNTPTPNLERP
jgi:hypothetical protein